MSVSLLEVINAGGYDLNIEEDARWLLSKQSEFDELVEQAQDLVEKIEEQENEQAEKEFQERFGDE